MSSEVLRAENERTCGGTIRWGPCDRQVDMCLQEESIQHSVDFSRLRDSQDKSMGARH
jgi:hypothetical protein